MVFRYFLRDFSYIFHEYIDRQIKGVMKRKERRVVITGMGAVTPLGNNVSSFWSGLRGGVSGAAPITLFDAHEMPVRFACEVRDFSPSSVIEPRKARRMDRYSHFALASAKEALEAAYGGDIDSLNKERVGVLWGSGIGGLHSFEHSHSLYNGEQNALGLGERARRISPFFIPSMIANIAAGWISMEYGFMGPNFATVSACASSNHALAMAYMLLKESQVDVVVAGGSEASITYSGIAGFNALRALSRRNDSPTTASRPYDKQRDGFVLAEGGACLILEDYDSARARGAHIHGELLGVGMSADAYHLTAPHKEGKGASLSMQRAIKSSGVPLEEIDYVNTHGTSTPLGDSIELHAIAGVFGEQVYKMNVSATKSMTGHMLGAAGVVESIACVLALEHSLIPPTINSEDLDDSLDSRINYTLKEAQSRKVRYAMNNSFGFGGQNATLIFGRL